MTKAPEQLVDAQPPGDEEDDDRGLELNGRTILTLCGFLAAMILALYLLLPRLAGLEDTWNRIEDGSPGWIVLAFALTFGMFGGYVELFRGVFGHVERIGRRESYLITMAGLAASRIFAAGGAGGLVLQAWALRAAGMRKREVADKTISFLVLTYFPYAAAVVICGFGLEFGIFPGEAPLTMTAVPAVIALILMGLTSLILLVPTDLQRRLDGFARRTGQIGRVTKKLATVPAATSAGLHDALRHIRSRNPALLGAILFWFFQIAVLWAAFQAFGDAPPVAVLIQAFFVGMLGNLLPIPGGVGGVEGGMIGAFAAFGIDAGLAVVAVLVFRAFTFWLPLVPGVIAFFRLRTRVEEWRNERERGATIQSKA
ncbi:lysylphosphatidylglycerol synthase transmembrane domain-containing protein [Solirubrobacter soli]|uniref:lysylphosphatidylglycerol synthase transmembrane domain-containing protein n=1 Tax=Solirubrobacter soli TaxID=363832 RepID=UPI0003F5316A|nr:lysylphosphatidylglycerol synthase transmembrane domain-containing protein [Solirubrobacter soli]